MPKCKELLRRLKKGGWYEKRRNGSHIILVHPDRKEFIVFPDHGSKEIATGTMKSILRVAGKQIR